MLRCDGRVIELGAHRPRAYASALVDTPEFLAEHPRPRIPLPTAIDSAGTLSGRIRMLTQQRPSRLSGRSATFVAGFVALPLIVAFAGPPRAGGPEPAARRAADDT